MSGDATAQRVGRYLAVVQLAFALTWIVYVIHLPQLVAQAGLPKQAVLWILMLDQLVFIACDFACGVASDRAARVLGRVGLAVLAATLVSCAAFVAMPFIAPQASPALLIALVLVWSATSSALRAPPLTLIGRYMPQPAVPPLIAWSLLGFGLASAAAPYLGLALRGGDPRVPFVLASVALALVTLGMVAAERALARAAPVSAPVVPSSAPSRPAGALATFALAAALAALAYQLHNFVNSTPLYLRHAEAAQLPWLAPLFWVGFNVALWPASLATKRWGGTVIAVCAVVAALAVALADIAASLSQLVALQLVAGAAWAGVLMSAFSAALALGRTGREGRFSGALSSMLALAALLRLVVVAGLVPFATASLGWLPVAAWLLAAALALALRRSHDPKGGAS